jgi:hypothetical protein
MPVIAGALRLSWRDRLQAARALAWLLAVHAGLRLLPYRQVRRLVASVGPALWVRPLSAEACSTAIARAGRLFPAAQCLSRAIAAECLLRRSGRDARLRFAAGFDQAHALQAHAWLESDGLAVTSSGAPGPFQPLD